MWRGPCWWRALAGSRTGLERTPMQLGTPRPLLPTPPSTPHPRPPPPPPTPPYFAGPPSPTPHPTTPHPPAPTPTPHPPQLPPTPPCFTDWASPLTSPHPPAPPTPHPTRIGTHLGGCILHALAQLPSSRALAVDAYGPAVAALQRTAEQNGLADRRAEGRGRSVRFFAAKV